MSSPVFISFYTEQYAEHAEQLVESLKEFGLAYDVRKTESKGSWDANTGIKPLFIMDMLNEYDDRHLIWIDADARMRAYPEFFHPTWDGVPVDIACHLFKGWELLSGTIYLKPSFNLFCMLQEWSNRCQRRPDVWDQKHLASVIMEWNEVRFFQLPPEYCFIHDSSRKEHPGLEPVIEHLQASRKMRSKVV